MRKTRIRTISITAIVISVLSLAILIVGAKPQMNQLPADRPQINQAPANRDEAKKPLMILKKDQPDSPLTITSVTVDHFPDSRMPTVLFNVLNNSGKRIMVYAIKHEAALGSRGTVSGYVTFNSRDSKLALRPGKAPEVEISGIQYPEPPESLTLSVDFVEFVDGTRWGEDTFKNGERIDGLRAGANAQREALMKVLRTDGPEEVIRSLDSITPESSQYPPRSAEWLDGFRHGVGWIRERVRSKGQNLGEIEKELRHPVDPKQERR